MAYKFFVIPVQDATYAGKKTSAFAPRRLHKVLAVRKEWVGQGAVRLNRRSRTRLARKLRLYEGEHLAGRWSEAVLQRRAEALFAFAHSAGSWQARTRIVRRLRESSLKGSKRVMRGSSWNNNARNCRAANRNRNEPGNRNNNVGFRVALSSARRISGQLDGTDRSPVRALRRLRARRAEKEAPGASSRASVLAESSGRLVPRPWRRRRLYGGSDPWKRASCDENFALSNSGSGAPTTSKSAVNSVVAAGHPA